MIKEKIKIHGGESFEIDLGYLYNGESKSSTYNIDTYIFSPRSLDINKSTYSKSDFFQDIKANIRFITPVYELNEIMQGDDSAFSKLQNSVKTYLTIPSNENAKQYRYHIKMFVSIFRSSLRRHVSRIVSERSIEDKKIDIQNLYQYIDELVLGYRKISKTIAKNAVGEREKNVFKFGNEFISFSLEKQFLILIRKLSKRKDDELNSELEYAKEYLEKELLYQKKNNASRLKVDSNNSNEETVYRRGIIRKFAEDRLFLNTRTEKEGVMVEQVIFTLAAGFAMIFATGVAFLTQHHYGNLTMPFFITLVISYMAKDRIKDLAKSNVNNRIQAKYFFDNKTKIISGDEQIGLSRESFNFIEDDKIPNEVKKKRNRDHLTEIENDWKGESVMLYRKRVTVYNKRFRKVFKEYEIRGIKDLTRINVSRFTTKMSAPYLPFLAWDERSKKVKKVKGEKVYHFNVVMVVKHKKERHIRRYRIFLNKKGIKRIEKVTV